MIRNREIPAKAARFEWRLRVVALIVVELVPLFCVHASR